MLKEKLDSRVDLQKYLFIRGFLITDRDFSNLEEFPFYGNWKRQRCGSYWIMAHSLTGMHIYGEGDKTFFLMGHAYNPFTMEHREAEILRRVAQSYGTENYLDSINELTGIYVYGVICGNTVEFYTDASGMQSACCCVSDGNFFLSSHPQLIGDLLQLEMDPFVQELIQYKWYTRVMGPYLPGDLTPFQQVKRVIPSIRYQYDGKLSHRRAFFCTPVEEALTPEAYENVIRTGADILKNNMILISRKWEKPWISLTGGIDSGTTFAAANGCYDRFETFSYLSAEKEIPDVEAAEVIAGHFGVKHHVYNIPTTTGQLEDYDLKVAIQAHNSGYVARRKDNESRKRIYLEANCQADVEVKSWTSETVRGYWYKHYGRKKLPPLSPKLFRNLYKIFLLNRKLAHKVDAVFADYIEKYEYRRIPDCYPAADIHFNEVTWGSWGGMNISEMKFCFDITVAYNNRVFLQQLFRVPLEKRISDRHHLDMRKYLNEDLYRMGIRVVNKEETKFRAAALNAIFLVNSILPF